jgi:hypothetical protein
MSTKARSKMISFRLSSAEYEQFRGYCETQGSSSLSELARMAVGRLIRDPTFTTGNGLENRVNELEGQLHLLAVELRRVKENTPVK